MLVFTLAKTVIPSFFTPNRSPKFPPEIVEQIVFYIRDVPTLFHFLVVSRGTSRTAEIALYHTIDLGTLGNAPIEHKVFNRWTRLIIHLLNSPRHASMVFYILGSMPGHSLEVNVEVSRPGRLFSSSHEIRPIQLEFNFRSVLAMMPNLRRLPFPRTISDQGFAIAQFSSNVLRELEMYSSTIYYAVRPGGYPGINKVEWLNTAILRQQSLRFLKVIPEKIPPDGRKLPERTQPLLTLPQQIEAIEGSLWLLKDVLPPTALPQRLRFWSSMDPFTETVTLSPNFWDRLHHVHVLSYCCSWGGENWLASEFPDLLSQLPLLQTLEIIIPEPGDSAIAIWMASTVLSSYASVITLVFTMPSNKSMHLLSLLGSLADLVFKNIKSLLTLEVGIVGKEYVRVTRENRDVHSGGIKRDDWWVYI
ncbi:hypothetical protein DL96DRAFT_1622188 [Flagelloscypha sp. PMI_526]|nr:hypothetical protein DL96DRAFT_1622188 [Flagelloscypha sp. PMI_526]